jgi:tRNA 2-selenouridine synthase
MLIKLTNLAQLAKFDSILDARTPAEYVLDHIPQAHNTPTLSDEERIIIGTTYKQVSAFEAKKHGAVLAARNIADHIEHRFMQKPKSWKPLVYCWRGGNRSGSMVTILRAIGWQALQLEGGYKAYRRLVVETLEQHPPTLNFQVIGGATGSGKSMLLDTLKQQGAQVLDLEQLARHRGSVLGRFADTEQPTQKWFDSQLAQQLISFNPAQPVFVEAESKKIGQISLPDSLMSALRQAPLCEVNVPLSERVNYLLHDYAEYCQHPNRLKQQLNYLRPIFGHARLEHWFALIDQQAFAELTAALLIEHYDPLYHKATHSQQRSSVNTLDIPALTPEQLSKAASLLIQASFPLGF